MTSLRNTGRYQANRFNRKNDQNQEGNPSGEASGGRLNEVNKNTKIDTLYGFHRVTDIKERTGFLINMHATEIIEDDKRLLSGIDYYFLEADCTRFKISYPYCPYFYILCKKDTYEEVSNGLNKKYSGQIHKVDTVYKEDLDLPNHLIGLKQKYLKLSFVNTVDMTKIRRDIMKAVKVNKERAKSHTYYTDMLSTVLNPDQEVGDPKKQIIDFTDNILDIREYDVPHHVRVSIDMKIFCGNWYSVKTRGNETPIITRREDIIEPPEPIVLAYDIETTKLPLKFPDANTDQIMMISYMIDGQGYLITNREIISSDIEDFEYTPKPEFEGFFTVFNEANEKALIKRFFDHINDIRPHIFVTYNGDFFDWPFVETRAAVHNMEMKDRIGFSKGRDGIYSCRPSMHMDCLCWVRRDSYLPVGSQSLKAVAKAKLRYDPVELDPEDMCRLAAEEPKTLASYSVSDAVATYYLYQKYVHPFIFALCTIIPMEPDEVLRKGSGTLCESLLMVQAFQANIIFPNKQEAELSKFTRDGHLLDQETYVGGHVEALESGVFRADIPCRFKIVPSAVDELVNGVENALKYTIQEEEKVPMEMVTNFDEVVQEIKVKLEALRSQPLRLENPVIYHLDVGAMYPNIILTNRLQPSAMVDETVCAACDYNKPRALCQRRMEWMWRGEYLAASLSEYQRMQQQLETEKFPPQFPGGVRRAYHELSKEEQAMYEKKRLSEYCRKVYKKVKITRTEERTQTICQKENSFYVDTVRAFRDRRYEYKALTKVAKQQVTAALVKGDAGDIKSAKNREVLYDSLQLAHKCILNSFYGYVMRKGSRWFSMEMGGIVCYTGAHIIMKAREIIEQVGRPLELDTDGIWCVLPASFPDNVVVHTTHPKKSRLTISYPNAILNFMVKDQFTNAAYHELVDRENLTYKVRSENSIFFEVDGPYLAMVLPAAKEEGKRLKKRYAVFNFDGSLAELKGFEVKRRGELQLIKIFQTSVFESFLKGSTLEECYASVAKDADYWLDVLYSKCADMPDTELFELISENKSMSRKLEDYGALKSTSISTAKRLAEFLGDQMVKDAGLACKYIIANKPPGAPVTERAIPLAIFQSEPAIRRHYLRKWLKDPGLQSDDIRQILDWGYYIERLGSAIQKIITIPAAMQGLSNPVPRVKHPDWLHKRVMEKNATHRQKKITDIFSAVPRNQDQGDDAEEAGPSEPRDIEDIAGGEQLFKRPVPVVNKRKRQSEGEAEKNKNKSWRDVLGSPPPMGTTKEERLEWLKFHKQKWAHQAKQRGEHQKSKKTKRSAEDQTEVSWGVTRANTNTATLGGFLRRAQKKLITSPWQIIQISPTNEPGLFRLWVLVDEDLHQLRLIIPRIFYVNTRKPKPDPEPGTKVSWTRSSKVLPRSRPIHNLYRYSVPEAQFQMHSQELLEDLSKPEIEGIYETQMSLEFRAILQLGCVCTVDPKAARKIPDGADTFTLDQLEFKSIAVQPYLKNVHAINYIFLYHHWSSNHQRAFWGLFLNASKRCHIFVLDSVSSNQMRNMNALYSQERSTAISMNGEDKVNVLPESMQFTLRFETNFQQLCRLLQAALTVYKNEGHGATIVITQTAIDKTALITQMPLLNDFPLIDTHVQDIENLYSTLEWQKVAATIMIRHYFKSQQIIELMTEQCRFFYVPIGNIPADPTVFAADLFYARHLQKNNFVLWCSPTEKPDLGGSENDDNRLLTDFEESSHCAANNPGTYSSVCIELEIESLAVNTLLQYHHIHDIDGTSSFVAFHNQQMASVQELATGDSTESVIPSYDETALCSPAFRILRSMVNAWLLDVSVYKNVFADYQIIHFYRWLRSSNALLYDPALQRTLHSYMKKLFIQLLAEFKTLGSIIIFANFNKIILCTKKRTVSDAVGYMEFVVQTIRNKEIFHSIEITFEQCWEYLIWLDVHNHAGVKGKLPKDLDENTETNILNDDMDNEDNDNSPEIVMKWNLMECLPKESACQSSFSAIIAGYINAIYQFMIENEQLSCTIRPRRKSTSLSQSLSAQLGLGSLENTADFAKKLISGDLSQKLFHIVQKIYKKLPEKELTIQEYPNLDLNGKESKKINPALELIKSVCKVLSLDKEINNEVYNLQNNMLRLVRIGSFSDAVEWKDPCVSLILPEIICKACNHTRDIDLCKDNFCVMEDDRYLWKCPLCSMSYDNEEIEYLLIDVLNRKSMGYMLQDLQCRKCNEIKRENMNELCSCSGDFKTLIPKNEIVKFVKICKSVAMKCNMETLMETVENTKLLIDAA
ncbi:PREDICTED: DNA polymerase epsilon catalytic subunit A [Dufourea novaeangliae]|uniref:DNA polymerase epsilon catalytic subunit n=1 Tax=Dufourea novaeangliae TaxID=178035 RepID=A0A154P6D1_DUFNO|nr:PREDICTED: DNA polymerase epsilon catalytic subunit A [Dufourea novaeangliae]KZC07383.1 DNA polymerase epsilon catalytic subunit A [Dufourea novaeangliae]